MKHVRSVLKKEENTPASCNSCISSVRGCEEDEVELDNTSDEARDDSIETVEAHINGQQFDTRADKYVNITFSQFYCQLDSLVFKLYCSRLVISEYYSFSFTWSSGKLLFVF